MQPSIRYVLHIHCDFESGLVNALKGHFPAPDTLITGCLFHFKQTLIRILKKDKISEPECEVSTESGVLDMLIVRP